MPEGNNIPVPPPIPPKMPPQKVDKPVEEKPAVVPALKQAPKAKQEVVFSTMHDDLKGINGSPVKMDKKPTSEAPPAAAPSASPKLPLAPTMPKFDADKATKDQPEKAGAKGGKNKKGKVILFLIVFLVIVLLISGVILALTFLSSTPNSTEENNDESTNTTTTAPIEPENEAVVAQEILPSNSELIVGYTAGAKSSLDTADATAVLDGNPGFLFENLDLNEVYYILLPDDPRPYLAVPASAEATSLLATNNIGQQAEVNGWLISHQLSPNNFEAILSEGSMADSGIFTPDGTKPISLYLAASQINSTRKEILGEQFTLGSLQSASLFGNQNTWTGLGNTIDLPVPEDASANTYDQSLLTLLPQSATTVVLGKDFDADLSLWNSINNEEIDSAILEEPGSVELLAKLNTSYAFFLDESLPQQNSYGLVITLSPALAGTLLEGDVALERTIQAVAPLVGNQRLAPGREFSSGSHAEVPLRYLNLDSPTAALDYVVTDQYLLIATSRETMFAIIETITGSAPAAQLTYQPLLNTLSASDGDWLTIGKIDKSLFSGLIPGFDGSSSTAGFVTTRSSQSTVTVNGIVID